MRKLLWIPSILLVAGLTACGGGGGYGGSSYVPPPPPPPSQVIASPAPNVVPVTVDAGPATVGAINTAYLSVTVCAPGSTVNCQTIDHVEVDTQSVGLRILASALTTVTLPMVPTGAPNAACAAFADGTAFGSIRQADIKLPTSDNGTSIAHAASVNVQVIGDPALIGTGMTPALPPTCNLKPENTVSAFGANGILGVAYFLDDCGSFCVTNSSRPITAGGSTVQGNSGTYYACTGTGTTLACTGATATEGSTSTQGQQLHNPVALFGSDSNGVILELPSVSSSGAASATGALVLGITSSGNNALGSAVVLPANPSTGNLTATYKGVSFPDSYLDSGSNGTYFHDTSITACTGSAAGFYCPASPIANLSVTFQGTTSANSTITFGVTNASTVSGSITALPTLAGDSTVDPKSFDGGLTLFFGRNVFTGFELFNTNGPYTAF